MKDRNQAGLVVNQEALDNIWPRLRVMARCQPEDKLTLVQGLMESTLYANAPVLKELKDKENISALVIYENEDNELDFVDFNDFYN